jgi:hypothetical protein
MAHGDVVRARAVALEMVLPYGEEALRLLWSLQAHETFKGASARRKVFQQEEASLREQLSEWLRDYRRLSHDRTPSWCEQLESALKRSKSGDGVKAFFTRATPQLRSINALIDDARDLLKEGQLRDAASLITALRMALKDSSEEHGGALREHYLCAGYLEVHIRLFAREHGVYLTDKGAQRPLTPKRTFLACEREYLEPGSVWSPRLARIRKEAIGKAPLEWL